MSTAITRIASNEADPEKKEDDDEVVVGDTAKKITREDIYNYLTVSR